MICILRAGIAVVIVRLEGHGADRLPQLRRGEPGQVPAVRVLRDGAGSGPSSAGASQDRHDRLLRPEGVHEPGRGARPGVPARGHDPLLRLDEGGARSPRRDDREVHRRCDHGRLRPPPAARGRRAPGGSRRVWHAAGAARAQYRPAGRLRRGAHEPDRRQHRRGRRGRCHDRSAPRHRRRGEHRGAARASRARKRGAHRRAHVRARARAGRRRGGRAARAQGQGRARRRIPVGRGRRGRRARPRGVTARRA